MKLSKIVFMLIVTLFCVPSFADKSESDLSAVSSSSSSSTSGSTSISSAESSANNNIGIGIQNTDFNIQNTSQQLNHSGNSSSTAIGGNQFQGISGSGNSHNHNNATGGVGYGGSGGEGSANQTQSVTGSGNSHQSQSVHDSGNSSATGGSSNQHQQANNAGNAQNVSMNTPKQHHNTPSAVLFVPPPTATCMASIGGSGMGAGFGLSISGTYRSEHCEKVELAKAFSSINMLTAAREMLCSTDHSHLVSECVEMKAQKDQLVKQSNEVLVRHEAQPTYTQMGGTVVQQQGAGVIATGVPQYKWNGSGFSLVYQ